MLTLRLRLGTDPLAKLHPLQGQASVIPVSLEEQRICPVGIWASIAIFLLKKSILNFLFSFKPLKGEVVLKRVEMHKAFLKGEALEKISPCELPLRNYGSCKRAGLRREWLICVPQNAWNACPPRAPSFSMAQQGAFPKPNPTSDIPPALS